MSVAHDPWTNEANWGADWHAAPRRMHPAGLLLPGVRFSMFALSAIIAGAVLAFVT